MMAVSAALLCFVAFAALSLSMRKHWHAALSTERDPPRRLLILVACAALIGSYLLTGYEYGWPIGLTLSVGLASLGAGLVVLVLAFRPSALVVNACGALLIAGALIVGS